MSRFTRGDSAAQTIIDPLFGLAQFFFAHSFCAFLYDLANFLEKGVQCGFLLSC